MSTKNGNSKSEENAPKFSGYITVIKNSIGTMMLTLFIVTVFLLFGYRVSSITVGPFQLEAPDEEIAESIELILEDRREDCLRGVPKEAVSELVTIG
jgi:hypothetical protein